MELYIFTRGREANQVTYNFLPPNLQDRVKLVVYENEAYAYNTFPNVYTVPSFPKGIGYKRQYVMERATGPVIFMDDDLTFARRREDAPTRFTECTGDDMVRMFHNTNKWLKEYAHGGVAMREGANRDIDQFRYNTRVCRVHYYNADVINRLGVRFNRLPVMEDFDVSLQLLRMGYANCTVNGYVQNQGGSQQAGGVSVYRTPAVQEEAAHALHELHPKFVTVVEKSTKEAWGGGTRIDVRIQWKKAFQEGCKLRGVDHGTI